MRTRAAAIVPRAIAKGIPPSGPDGRAAIAGMYSQYFGGMPRGSTTTFTLESVRDVENNHAFADGQ